MRWSLQRHWDNINKVVSEDKPKEEILKTVYDALTDIETEMGWLDERRQDAEDSFQNLYKDYETSLQQDSSTASEKEEEEDQFFIHSNYPLIFSKDNFLSKEECEHIINISQPHLKEATIYNENSGRDEVSDYRKCKVCYFSHDHDDTVTEIVEKISSVVAVSPTRAEKLQVIAYDGGEYFDYHTDAFDISDINMKDGGQRIFTSMVYLNDVPEGGETHFKILNITVEPKEGRLLVFRNCLKNSNIQNTQTLHAGLPVKKGRKYAINLWYREDIRSEYAHLLQNARTF